MSIPAHILTNQLGTLPYVDIVDPILQAINERVAPAISLTVMQGNTCLFDATWGYLDPDERLDEVTPAHYFDLASVTKLYTTVALLSLLTEHKLALSTPLVDIIPAFGDVSPRPIDGGQDPHTKEALNVDPAFVDKTVDPQRVTLQHLLTHTSGLPPWRDVYTVAPAPAPPFTDDSKDTVSTDERWQRALERLCRYAFVAPPDTGVRYSDIGLMLLGEVVARLGGQRLDRVISERVDNKALYNPTEHGIARTDIVPTEIDPTWRKRRVHGEVHDENACGVGGIAGHAGLFATARTVATLGVRWLNRGYAISDAFYDAATQRQAQTGRDVRGLGWVLRSSENSSSGDLFSPNSYGHTGFTGTSLWIDPERQLSVALLTNRVYGGREKVGIHALRRAVHDAVIKAVDV